MNCSNKPLTWTDPLKIWLREKCVWGKRSGLDWSRTGYGQSSKVFYLYCCTVHFGDNLLHTNEGTVIL